MRQPIAPLTIFLAMWSAGCDRTSMPTPTPQPTAPTAGTSSPTASGIVAEGGRPIDGAQVDNGYGRGAWVFSDANGAFQLPLFASVDPHNFVRASKAGYTQQCAAPIGTGPVNVQMVSLTALDAAPLPSPAGYRTISGVVTMTVDGGKQPVAGAWVDFEPGADSDDWPAAVTSTDTNGKFSLCTLPEPALYIGAVKGSLFAHATVPPGQTAIELTLQAAGAQGEPLDAGNPKSSSLFGTQGHR